MLIFRRRLTLFGAFVVVPYVVISCFLMTTIYRNSAVEEAREGTQPCLFPDKIKGASLFPESALFLQKQNGLKMPPAEIVKTQLQQQQQQRQQQQTGQPVKENVTMTATRAATTANTTVRPDSCDGCFLTDFPVILDQPDLCQAIRGQDNIVASEVDVVYLIVSAVPHGPQRAAIRATWASVTRNNTDDRLRHVFITGNTANVEHTRQLEEEARHFRDVVVVDFHDSYLNLTLKTVAALRWVSTRCRRARFFVKLDDDLWVNSPVLVKHLNESLDFLQHGMAGHCMSDNYVHRYNWSKWYVPKHLHPAAKYAPYCIGFGYAGSVSVAEKIVAVSKDVPFFHLEDVYMGMCLKRLKFGIRTIKGFRNYQHETRCEDAKSSELSTILDSSPKRLHEYWTGKCPQTATKVPNKKVLTKKDV